LPIISVSSVPDAPTSAPEMMSTSLPSAKPVSAAASPVNELSSEMMTGMSAPPIGNTKSTPSTAAATSAAKNAVTGWKPTATHTRPAIAISARSPLTTCWPGYVIGRPVISSCSLRNAMMEPVNEIEPMIAVSTDAMERSGATASIDGLSLRYSALATIAAAPPPQPLKIATICGIAVIFTERAK
jgi:hypothetical protein